MSILIFNMNVLLCKFAVVASKFAELASKFVASCSLHSTLNAFTITRDARLYSRRFNVRLTGFARRYCVKHKDDKQPGWELVYTCGGCDTDNWMEEAFNAWRVANKSQIFVGRIALTPSNILRKISEFKARNLRTLSLHASQIVRLMLLQGNYVLSPELAANGMP